MRTLRVGLPLTALLAVPVLAVAGAVKGGRGVLGGALGLGLVAAFFTVGKVVLAAVARRSTRMLFPAAMGTYLGKVVVLGVCFALIAGQSAFDRLAFAWAVVVGVVGWVAAELWVAIRTREPFYDPQAFRGRVPPAAPVSGRVSGLADGTGVGPVDRHDGTSAPPGARP